MEASAPESRVPGSLVRRIEDALRETDGEAADPRTQLRAAEACLQQALARGSERCAALDLLAADGLLTAACGAAVGTGSMTVETLALEAAGRLARLLETENDQ